MRENTSNEEQKEKEKGGKGINSVLTDNILIPSRLVPSNHIIYMLIRNTEKFQTFCSSDFVVLSRQK